MGDKQIEAFIKKMSKCKSFDALNDLATKKLKELFKSNHAEADACLNAYIKKLTVLANKDNVKKIIALLTEMHPTIIEFMQKHTDRLYDNRWIVIHLLNHLAELSPSQTNAKNILLLLKMNHAGKTIGHLIAPFYYMMRQLIELNHHLLKRKISEKSLFELFLQQDDDGKTIEYLFLKNYDEKVGDKYFELLQKLVSKSPSTLLKLWSLKTKEHGNFTGSVVLAQKSKSLLDHYFGMLKSLFDHKDVDTDKLFDLLHDVVSRLMGSTSSHDALIAFFEFCRFLLSKKIDANQIADLFFDTIRDHQNLLFYVFNSQPAETSTALFDLLKDFIRAGADADTIFKGLRRQTSHLGHVIAFDSNHRSLHPKQVAEAFAQFLVFLHEQESGVKADAIQTLLAMRVPARQKNKKVQLTFCEMMLANFGDDAGQILYPLVKHGLVPNFKHRKGLRKAIAAHVCTLSQDERDEVSDNLGDVDHPFAALYSKQKHLSLFFKITEPKTTESRALKKSL